MTLQNNGTEHNHGEQNEGDPLKGNDEESHINKNISFCGRCRYVLLNVTMEPVMFLFIVACVVMMMTSQNLYLQKACRVNLNYTEDICESLKTQKLESLNQYEKEAQKLLAKNIAWKTYLTATIPCILALLIGSWSDKTGRRKMFLAIPIIGQILACLNGIFHSYFLLAFSLEVVVLIEAVFESFSGGWSVAVLTVFAYISAITTDKTRTFRIGMVNFSLTVGFPIGMGVSGILIKNYGYFGGFGLAAFLHTINLIYVLLVLKDPRRTPEQMKNDGRGLLFFTKTFFDLTNIKDTISVVLRNKPEKRRIRLCVLLVVVCILFGPMYGEISVMYMSTRYRFNWDEVKFSIFQTYNFVTHTIGTIFSITVFSKCFQWHDSILGIISTVSKIASSAVYCFAANEKVFFIAPLVDILNATSLLAMRSIVSKLVEKNELGKVNSIFGLTENLMPLLFVPLYTRVYTATMETLPGAVFLMGAALTLPAVAAFIWLLYEHRRNIKKLKWNNSLLTPQY